MSGSLRDVMYRNKYSVCVTVITLSSKYITRAVEDTDKVEKK
jgi:hypothetical protein